MTLFGYDQGVFGKTVRLLTATWGFVDLKSNAGGVIVTPDFLDTLNLSGPEHTSLLGTVTALYDVGCFFGAVYVSSASRSWSFRLSRHIRLGGPGPHNIFQDSKLRLEQPMLTSNANLEPLSLSVKD